MENLNKFFSCKARRLYIMKGQFIPLEDFTRRKRFPYAVSVLIILNTMGFIFGLGNFDYIVRNFGFVASSASMQTMITSMFIHAGFDHIFWNMWFLWMFGNGLEKKSGMLKFTMLYFFSGMAADAFQYLTDPMSNIPSIGASGAISGALGAYFIYFPKNRIMIANTIHGPLTAPSYALIGLWFVTQFVFGILSFFGFSGSNIAFWAHIGGFLAGVLFASVVKK